MALEITASLYEEITTHLRDTYPKEGAGLLLGHETEAGKKAMRIVTLENKFAPTQQHHRYLITAEDMLAGETAADDEGMEILGVYHSHPDHPAEPSSFDHANALPWYSYLIVSVQNQHPDTVRCWRLSNDRSRFSEEDLVIQA